MADRNIAVMKYLILILISALSFGSFAKPKQKMKNERIEVSGVGTVKVIHDVVGEPIGQPERLQVFMKCQNSTKEFRLQIYRMCLWEDFEFDTSTKTLILKLATGRVEPKSGNVLCDLIDTKEIDLSAACKSR